MNNRTSLIVQLMLTATAIEPGADRGAIINRTVALGAGFSEPVTAAEVAMVAAAPVADALGLPDPDAPHHVHPASMPCNVMCPAHPHTIKGGNPR